MVLLDTHALLWALTDDHLLTDRAKWVIMRNARCISIASLWELAIKASLPRVERRITLRLSIEEIVEMCEAQDVAILPITPEDCARVMTLPHIHEDPFDRIIIAQAMERDLPLVTKDENIARYEGVEVVW